MMKRKAFFGITATLVACTAIGAGVIATQNAMASGRGGEAVDSVTIGALGRGGIGYQCVFSGAEAQTMLQNPAGSGGRVQVSVGSIASGESVTGSAVAPAGDPVSSGVAVPPPTGEPTVIDTATLRNGTAEECAALQSDLEATFADSHVLYVSGAAVPETGVTAPVAVAAPISTP